jgi:hypothetical protein
MIEKFEGAIDSTLPQPAALVVLIRFYWNGTQALSLWPSDRKCSDAQAQVVTVTLTVTACAV